MKHYETELPEGYVEAKVVDAKTTKISIIFTLVSLAITGVVFAAVWLIFKFGFDKNLFEGFGEDKIKLLLSGVIFFGAFIAYTILHELTHGLVYKVLTKQKLTFGITPSVAYCGVPNIYVYRTAAILALLAPFTVFSIAYLLPIILLGKYTWLQLVFAVLFSVHVGGCVGDLYDTALYTFKFRDASVLMRDTGPQQTFYVLATSALGQKILAAKPQKEVVPAVAEVQEPILVETEQTVDKTEEK